MLAPKGDNCAACYPASRAQRCLQVVAEVLRQEGLAREPFVPAKSRSCDGLQEAWKEWQARSLVDTGRAGEEARLAVKGCKTLFDEPCFPCDKGKKLEARKVWDARIQDVRVTDPQVLTALRQWVGRVLRGWRYVESGEVYVPDQQGCFETKTHVGGTLATPEDEEDVSVRHVRVGYAKTKGKIRVVTMQGAKAKRLFSPVHRSLYGYLAKKRLVIKGDVTPSHFESLPLLEGDFYISGDYSSATDYLHADAVQAVVDVVAEKLPESLATELRASFLPIVYEKGHIRAIKRGAMMGNLVSFPILCLINRFCVEQALDASRRNRVALINGDDCAFTGNEQTFRLWNWWTSQVGLVVNHDKTGVSPNSAELNSELWVRGRAKLTKKLTFGFLGKHQWRDGIHTDETRAVSPIGALFTTLNKLRFKTAVYLLLSFPVRSFLEIARPGASEVPRRWFSFLRKKRMFRTILLGEEPEIVGKNERAIPMVYGPLVHCQHRDEVRAIERVFVEKFIDHWRGVEYRPQTLRIKTKEKHVRARLPRVRIEKGPVEWARMWVKPALELVMKRHPEYTYEETRQWADDQFGLTTHQSWLVFSTGVPCPFPYDRREDVITFSNFEASWLALC